MDNISKIKKEIFLNPTYKYHIRELARKTSLNPNTIINLLPLLKNLVIKDKRKNLVEVFADIKNKEFIRKKRNFNIEQIYDSGLIDFLIDFYNNPESITVMGSYSRGEDIERSDIDMVIITEKEKLPEMDKFEKYLHRKIHLIVTTYKDMSKEFHLNMINGITLHGFIK